MPTWRNARVDLAIGGGARMSVELIVFLKFCAFTIPAWMLLGFLFWDGRRESAKEKLANEKERGA